jgi:hypothetical protein
MKGYSRPTRRRSDHHEVRIPGYICAVCNLPVNSSVVERLQRQTPHGPVQEEACIFLRLVLESGPLPVREIMARGARAGFSHSVLRRARVQIAARQVRVPDADHIDRSCAGWTLGPPQMRPIRPFSDVPQDESPET